MEKIAKDAGFVRRQLLKEIKTGIYKDETRLPPESVLAERMQVSRTLIRDSLASLEREGFISRRHGIGTVINKHVVSVTTRMDLEVEFLDMIRQAGAEPGVSYTRIEKKFCDAYIASKLGVVEDTPYLKVEKVITADKKPVIFCADYVSLLLVKNFNYTEEDLSKPVFLFLENFCDTDVYMDLTVVRAVAADRYKSELLQVPEGTPLLNMDEIGYDIEGNRVLWSEEFYVDDILVHTVMRKKI